MTSIKPHSAPRESHILVRLTSEDARSDFGDKITQIAETTGYPLSVTDLYGNGRHKEYVRVAVNGYGLQEVEPAIQALHPIVVLASSDPSFWARANAPNYASGKDEPHYYSLGRPGFDPESAPPAAPRL